MQDSQIPAKFQAPFAYQATTGYIRSIPLNPGSSVAASLSLGFPPLTATPVEAGGTPPNIQDFNGILNQITAWSQWNQAGGPVVYDSAFSTAIGGYPKGAILANASTVGAFWISTVDNNTSNPDTGGANWTGFTLTGLGTAAYKATSDNSQSKVAAVKGAITVGHFAVFADTNGTVQDGGAPASFGTAAQKNASDNTKSTVASVSGGTTSGHFLSAADGSGTVQDSGYNQTSFDAAGAAASAQAAAIAASAQRSANLSDLASASSARNNLGLQNGATTQITISTSGPSGTPGAPALWFQI